MFLEVRLPICDRNPPPQATFDAHWRLLLMLNSIYCSEMELDEPSPPSESETAEAVHRLKIEIDKLTEQQVESFRSATFIGMTSDEAKEYDQRRKRILRCVQDLKMLEEPQ
jgi:hypothetical protein